LAYSPIVCPAPAPKNIVPEKIIGEVANWPKTMRANVGRII
jgi:hypothetical protein